MLRCNNARCSMAGQHGQHGHRPARPARPPATGQHGHRPARPPASTATGQHGHRPARPARPPASTASTATGQHGQHGHRPARPCNFHQREIWPMWRRHQAPGTRHQAPGTRQADRPTGTRHQVIGHMCSFAPRFKSRPARHYTAAAPIPIYTIVFQNPKYKPMKYSLSGPYAP